MKSAHIACAFVQIALPAFADTKATEDQVTRINDLLASMTCEVDPDNIEVEDDGGFDLDDVICADGQYDIRLDAEYNEVEKRKE